MRSGDIVLIRTGQIAQVRARGSWGEYDSGPAPGLGVGAAHWFAANEIAALATDTWGAEVLPNDTPGVFQPLHLILLVNDDHRRDLRPRSARDRVRGGRPLRVLLHRAAAAITGAVGSPVNPLAIF